jgi:hypothetical protein
MKTQLKIFVSATLVLANMLTVFSQQTDSAKPAPSLSSDGIMARRVKPAAGWKRYSPEGFGLSLELPGEPLERPYSTFTTLNSEIKKSSVLDYLEDNLEVNVVHLVLKKPIELRWIAEVFKESLNPKNSSEMYKCGTLTMVPQSNRFLLTGRCSRFGTDGEMRAVVLLSGGGICFISVQTSLENAQGDSVSSRILDSIAVGK